MASRFLLAPAAILALLLASAVAMEPRCPVGSIRDNGRCKLCPAGTYNDHYMSTCKPCPRGTYFPYTGGHGSDVCLPCPPGTSSNKIGATSAATCVKCPPGTDSPEASRRCLACAPGTYFEPCPFTSRFEPPPFRGVCLFRNPGVDFAGHCTASGFTRPKCVKCPSNTFSNTANAFSCQKCPFGTTSIPGSTACRAGPPACHSFEVPSVRSSFCQECPEGFIGESENKAVNCVPCPAGTYRNESVSGQCKPCPPGHNTATPGASFCLPDRTPCPPNYFRAATGACQRCTKFQRYDRSSKSCVPCPDDSFSSGGLATTCEKCPDRADLIERFGQPECRCQPGFGWKPGFEGRKCAQCPKGTASRDGTCEPCYPNRFASRRGMEQCERCPVGTEQPRSGQSRCLSYLPCPDGLIPSPNSRLFLYTGCVNPATNCPPDHERRVVFLFNFPECLPKKCPPGTAKIYIDERNPQASCSTCSPGTRYDPKAQQCVDCAFDETSDGGLSTVCKKCELGTISRSGKCECVGARRFVNGICKLCPAGTFGSYFSEGCAPCPAGSFNRRKGESRCEKCPAGTFTDKEGAVSCTPCPDETTNFRAGETGCVKVGSLPA